MKNMIKRLCILTVVIGLQWTVLFAQGVKITLVHLNDTHSHLDAFGPKTSSLEGTIGGIAKAATVIGTIKSTDPNVLLLHGGDFFQGDPMFNTYFGVPELELLKSLGFDAMVVGNHEFHFGPDVYANVVSTAFASGSFPILSANIDLSGYPPLQPWIQPSIMKTYDGIKVGIFGLTIPEDPAYMLGPVVINEDFPTIAGQMVENLRGSGADVVICLSHMGIYLDKILAANVPGIDFIVGAHDHFVFTQPVPVVNPAGKTTYIFQAGQFYEDIGELHFTVDNGVVTINDYTMIPIDASVSPEPGVKAIVDELKQGVVAKFGDIYNTVLSVAANDLVKVYDTKTPLRDTPMGNLVTDAYRAETHTDLAITANGLISEQLYKGPIVGADVFRSLGDGYDEETGYGFRLATMKIQGSELIKGMEIGLSQLGIDDDIFLQFSGLRFSYDPTQPVGSRVILQSIEINGAPIDPTAKYSVTVNSGLAALLGSIGISVEDLTMLSKFEIDVVDSFISMHKTLSYHAQGRILEQNRKAFWGLGNGVKNHEPLMSEILMTNAPNPFNPSTTIRYQIPIDGFVHIWVYNMLGQQVSTLIERQMTKGSYEVVWNASDKPSGMYFYRLDVAPARATDRHLMRIGKMILAK